MNPRAQEGRSERYTTVRRYTARLALRAPGILLITAGVATPLVLPVPALRGHHLVLAAALFLVGAALIWLLPELLRKKS